MMSRLIGLIATVAFLLVPSPLDLVRCEAAQNPEPPRNAPYEINHSFDMTPFIAASREIDRRIRLCGDPDMQPIPSARR